MVGFLAVLQPIALTTDLDDVGVMQESIEQCRATFVAALPSMIKWLRYSGCIQPQRLLLDTTAAASLRSSFRGR